MLTGARLSLLALPCFLAVASAPLAARAADRPAPAPAPVPVPASATAVPPDVVLLKDHSMYRGTISELVAGDHVDIVVASGQSHHFAMSDVTYAGPSAGMPGGGISSSPLPPPPPPPPPGGVPPLPPPDAPADVRVDATEPDISFHVKTGSAIVSGVGWGGRHAVAYTGVATQYQVLCTAPCTTSLPTGTHHLGLSRGQGTVIEPEYPTIITGPGTLHGNLDSRAGVRLAGWLVFGGSVVGGAALMLASFQTHHVCDDLGGSSSFCYDSKTLDGGLFGAGVAVMALGSLTGVLMARVPDVAEISFVPLAPASGSARGREGVALDPRGFQIRATF